MTDWVWACCRPGDEGLQPSVMLCLLRQEAVLAEAQKSIASHKYNAAATDMFRLSQRISIVSLLP